MRIAITGQTWAQGATGSWQCMQTVGWVATLMPRLTKSTMTILSPLCELHSRQAASQERQPIQREGSTNKVLTVTSFFSPFLVGLGLFGWLILGLANGVW